MGIIESARRTDVTVDIVPLKYVLQIPEHLPQLGHLWPTAVNHVRKPFLLQPLLTFLSSSAASAVRDYRRVLLGVAQRAPVESRHLFLLSRKW